MDDLKINDVFKDIEKDIERIISYFSKKHAVPLVRRSRKDDLRILACHRWGKPASAARFAYIIEFSIKILDRLLLSILYEILPPKKHLKSTLRKVFLRMVHDDT